MKEMKFELEQNEKSKILSDTNDESVSFGLFAQNPHFLRKYCTCRKQNGFPHNNVLIIMFNIWKNFWNPGNSLA